MNIFLILPLLLQITVKTSYFEAELGAGWVDTVPPQHLAAEEDMLAVAEAPNLQNTIALSSVNNRHTLQNGRWQ